MKILSESLGRWKAHLKVELDDKFCKDKWVHVVCKQVEEAPVTEPELVCDVVQDVADPLLNVQKD